MQASYARFLAILDESPGRSGCASAKIQTLLELGYDTP